MKKTYFILAVFLMLLGTSQVGNAQVQPAQVIEHMMDHEDSLEQGNKEEPIVKTVVVEEDADEIKMPQNKWVGIGLALFGIVLAIVLRTLRKKKRAKKQAGGN